MINIRYHIVSITAVFLALGIGVALGSTFLDRATVDVLDANIRSAEERIDATNRANSQLKRERDDAEDRDASLIEVGSEDLVAGHLTDLPVVLITAPGVDDGDVEDLETVLERSGSDVRGTISLSDKLRFEGDFDEGLAEDLGADATTQASLGTEVRRELSSALASAGSGEPNASNVGSDPTVLVQLADHDYLDLDPGPGHDSDDPILAGSGHRYVVVGAPGLELADDQVVLDLLAQSDEALPAVVVSATVPAPQGDEEPAESLVTRLRDTTDLADTYSTVDDADTFAGMVATLYVLQQIDDLAPDHYGQAEGASAVLPPVP